MQPTGASLFENELLDTQPVLVAEQKSTYNEIDPAFPTNDLDKSLCAYLMDAVAFQPSLRLHFYLDFLLLVMQTERCRTLLPSEDRSKLTRAIKSLPDELTSSSGGKPPWRLMVSCLIANRSLDLSDNRLTTGGGFDEVRKTLPKTSKSLRKLVVKATQRAAELLATDTSASESDQKAANDIKTQRMELIVKQG
ncbi:hypothetical protein [Gimesia sp.]|uniref:hypothetical protein n=1 Tax=Gimesia sp. TaxID=2024833 RepID=UPI0025C4B4AB|nr:hypothetical protein [Gimesia sp.]